MRTIRVHFSDACTDVLVYLTGLGGKEWRTVFGIAEATAPPDADTPIRTANNALATLRDAGLVEVEKVDDWVMWRATQAGKAAVRAASQTSTGVDETPDERASHTDAPTRAAKIAAAVVPEQLDTYLPEATE